MKPPKFEDLIIFENEHFVAVNKPPFLSTLEDRSSTNNLLKLARDYNEDLTPCHRLDKETSGLLVLAKSAEAYRHMSLQFEHRKIIKIYHAVSDGVHTFENTEVDAPLYVTAKGYVRISKSKGKDSKTHFTTIEKYRGHTLIECSPLTGRTHQIRVHLRSLGAPIACDELYGGKTLFLSALKKKFHLAKDVEEQPLIKRVALHAYRLIFSNLDDGKIEIEAPYPKDFAIAIKQLQKFS